MKERYLKVISKYETVQEYVTTTKAKLNLNIDKEKEIESMLSILFAFNEHMNIIIREKLENITNTALKSIFPDKEMSFHVMPNRTKRGTFYNVYIETNGMFTELFDAKGGGVIDVVAICLRITYLIKMKGILRQTLILDEPLKNLDANRINLAAAWLKHITEVFDIQFVMVTHIPALALATDPANVIEVKQVNGKSYITKG